MTQAHSTPGLKGALLALAVALLVSLLSIPFVAVTFDEWRVYRALRDEGVTAPALVIDRKVSSGGRGRFHEVSYRLELPGPQGQPRVHSGNQRVSEALFARLSPGGEVAVRYVVGEPDIARLEETVGPPLEETVATSVAVLLVLLLLTWTLRMLSTAIRQRWSRAPAPPPT